MHVSTIDCTETLRCSYKGQKETYTCDVATMWLHSNTARISFRKRATLQQPATSNMSHNNHDPTVGVWRANDATDAVQKADPVLDNNHHSFQYPV